MNIMNEKIRVLLVWIKREVNRNKFKKGLFMEMIVKFRFKG